MKRGLAVGAAVVAWATLMPMGSAQQRTGYLASGAFDILAVLPPAPVKGEARYDADRRIFRRTRALLGTPRGTMATSDVTRTPAAMLVDYACSLGMTLNPAEVPKTVAVIERASLDTNAQKERAKTFYHRLRPIRLDRGAVCQPRAKLERTYDYPSGHTTGGWTWALILAQLVPDRASQILARGRAFGQSRVVCGAHNASAVEAGFMTAGATMTVIGTVPQFQADLAAAKEELAAARRDAPIPDAARCAGERRLVAQHIY
jgi:acid phosphatase (class A)